MYIRGSYNLPLKLVDEHTEQLAPRLNRRRSTMSVSAPAAGVASTRTGSIAAAWTSATRVSDPVGWSMPFCWRGCR